MIILLMVALAISGIGHLIMVEHVKLLIAEKRGDRDYYRRLLGWRREEDHWDDFCFAWHDVGLQFAADRGDQKAILMISMEREADRRGGDEEWLDVYADLAHWTRYCREWHFVGHQYAMETLLARVRADVAGPRPSYMHPVVGVERVVQALHAAGFVSDEGARRAGGRLPS